MEAKYDKTLEAGVRAWIEKTTGESIGPDFQEGLKNGQILCKYVYCHTRRIIQILYCKVRALAFELLDPARCIVFLACFTCLGTVCFAVEEFLLVRCIRFTMLTTARFVFAGLPML